VDGPGGETIMAQLPLLSSVTTATLFTLATLAISLTRGRGLHILI
jgi:hypothetical protein